MGRPKKFLEARVKTSARIPEGLHREIDNACHGLGMDKTEAINDGLLLWLVFQEADKGLAAQMESASKRIKARIDRETEKLREEAATTKTARRILAG